MILFVDEYKVTNGFTTKVILQTCCNYCDGCLCGKNPFGNVDLQQLQNIKFVRIKCNIWRCDNY